MLLHLPIPDDDTLPPLYLPALVQMDDQNYNVHMQLDQLLLDSQGEEMQQQVL